MCGVLGVAHEAVAAGRRRAGWTSTRSRRGWPPAASAPSSPRWARRLGALDPPHADRRPLRRARRAAARRRRLRRLLRAARRRRRPQRRAAPFARDRPRRLGRHRPAQARPAALWLRLRAVRRPGGRALLRARLALHLLHLRRAAPRRDQPRVLARRRRGGRAVGDAAGAAADPRRPRRAARRHARGRPRARRRGWPPTTGVALSSSPSWTSSAAWRAARPIRRPPPSGRSPPSPPRGGTSPPSGSTPHGRGGAIHGCPRTRRP